MNDENKKAQIMNLLYSERVSKRIAGIRKVPSVLDKETLDYLVLLLQIDEKKKIRKAVLQLFSELQVKSSDYEEKIITAITKAIENEPDDDLQEFARLSLKKRKKSEN